MSRQFFAGTYTAKLDEKGRFVLPQQLRFGLVEEGKLEFTIALSLGGSLAIYSKNEIALIVSRLQKLVHIAKYQKFITLFFSTLVETTCDKIGRVTLPAPLQKGGRIKKEIVLAGALNKIELWPKEVYEKEILSSLQGTEESFVTLMEEAFAFETVEGGKQDLEATIDKLQQQTKTTVQL